MKIKIHDNACQLHARSVPAHMGYTSHQFRYREILSQVQGATLDVDTDYLFKDQFNAIAPGVSDLCLAIPAYMVAEVINDARPGKARCSWCGTTSTDVKKCTKCENSGHLHVFKDNGKVVC